MHTACTSARSRFNPRRKLRAAFARSHSQIARHLDLYLTACAGAIALLIFLKTLAPGVLDADSGEFQYAAYSLGLPHPTGYPLYVLIGKAWSSLPIGTLAYRMNLLSAIFAALTVAAMYLLLRKFERSRLAALTASMTLAFSSEFWSQAVITEIYTLNTLLIVGCLGISLAARREWAPRQYRLLQALAIVAGLSLAHHRTAILVLPGIAIYLWPALAKLRLSQISKLCLLLASPLLLYLYIPLRAPGLGWSGSVSWALGTSFAGSMGRVSVEWLSVRALSLADLFVAQQSLVGFLISLLGLAVLLRVRSNFTLATGITGIFTAAFYLQYDVADAHVFLLPLYILATIWLAAGLDALVSVRPLPSRASIARFSCLLLPIGLMWFGYPNQDMSNENEVERAWQERLQQPLVGNAAIVAEGGRLSPLRYFQTSAGLWPDIRAIGADMNDRHGWDKLQSWIDTGNTAYLLDPLSRVPRRYDLRRIGPLTEIKRADEEATLSALQELESDGLKLAGYWLDQPRSRPGSSVDVNVYWSVTQRVSHDYAVYVHLIDQNGVMIAQHDKAPFDYNYFTYETSHWLVGEDVRDRFQLAIPESAAPGMYVLEAGLYLIRAGTPESVLRAQLGALVVSPEQPAAPFSDRPIAEFGERLRLVEAKLGQRELVAGKEIEVTLRWQAIRRMTVDYTIFVHLVDPFGKLVAQSDGPPLSGRYPTSWWETGELVEERRGVLVPAKTRSGEYHLYVGAYTLDTMERLPVAAGGSYVDLGVLMMP